MENEEFGKRGVWKIRSVAGKSFIYFDKNLKVRLFNPAILNFPAKFT